MQMILISFSFNNGVKLCGVAWLDYAGRLQECYSVMPPLLQSVFDGSR